MGIQPFRQLKSDGTMEDAGVSAGGGGVTEKFISDPNINFDNSNYGWNLFWPFITTASYAQPTNWQATLLSNYVVAYPFLARKTGDVTRLSIRITSGSGTAGAVRIGIYDTDDDGWPDSLLGIATPASINSTGVKTTTSFTTNDGSTSPTISLTKNEQYWVMYGAISDVTDLPQLGSPLNQTYNLPTYSTEFYLNGGGYNGRGTYRFRNQATNDTLAKLMPSTFPAASSLNAKSMYNSQASGTPIWVGVRN